MLFLNFIKYIKLEIEILYNILFYSKNLSLLQDEKKCLILYCILGVLCICVVFARMTT